MEAIFELVTFQIFFVSKSHSHFHPFAALFLRRVFPVIMPAANSTDRATRRTGLVNDRVTRSQSTFELLSLAIFLQSQSVPFLLAAALFLKGFFVGMLVFVAGESTHGTMRRPCLINKVHLRLNMLFEVCLLALFL